MNTSSEASPSHTHNPKQLRLSIRRQRAQLTRQDQARMGHAISNRVLQNPHFISANNIALYVAAKGEVNVRRVIEHAFKRRKKVYLPTLHPLDKKRMLFIRYKQGDALVKNRFGMFEPKLNSRNSIPPRFLSLVLCPLVGFDDEGNRMGMGGGFYDRHFAFKLKHRGHARPPHMIGLAYEFQRVPRLPTQPWDVPMTEVITEAGTHQPRKNC